VAASADQNRVVSPADYTFGGYFYGFQHFAELCSFRNGFLSVSTGSVFNNADRRRFVYLVFNEIVEIAE